MWVRLDLVPVVAEDVVGSGERHGPISNGLPMTVAISDKEKEVTSVTAIPYGCFETGRCLDGWPVSLTYAGLRLDG